MTETIEKDAEVIDLVPAGYMEDSKGRFVPESRVKAQDKLEDQTVRKIVEFATDLSHQIGRFKAHTYDDLSSLMDILRENYHVTKGGAKGNCTFTSFDGRSKVVVAVQDHLDFGPELKIAKELIDECIAEWATDASDRLQALVNHAFNVDKPGKVNREALFALRNLEMDDERWARAVDAINKSIKVTGSKTYVRIYERDSVEDKWQQIAIDLAAA